MGLISCPDCNGMVSEIAPACPHCGRPIAPASTPPPPLDEAKQETVTVKVHGKEIAAPKLSATTQTIRIGASPPPPSPVPATKPPQLSFLWRCYYHWFDNLRFWFFVFWGVLQIGVIIGIFMALEEGGQINGVAAWSYALSYVIILPPVLAFSFMIGLSIWIGGFAVIFTDGEPIEEIRRQSESGELDKPLLGPIASKLVSWTFIGLGISGWIYRILFFGMVVALIVYAISQALK